MSKVNTLSQYRRRLFQSIEIGVNEDVLGQGYDIVNMLSIIINLVVSTMYTFEELRLPYGMIVAAIQRDGHVIVPRGDVVLQVNDTLVLGAPSYGDEDMIDLKEVVLRKQNPWNGQCIRDLDISRQTIIIMVKRGGKVLIPNGDLVLIEGDTVILYTKMHMANATTFQI